MKSKRSFWQRLATLVKGNVSRKITCQELGGFMVDYFDGTLPRAQRRRFDSHLNSCPDCVRYLKSYERTVVLSQAACHDADTVTTQDMPDQLVDAILSARDKE